ncbi:MAG: T9SS type A sorting domain-containing protein, partial [Bacteroidia bacterium]
DGFSSGWVQETNNGGISWIYTYTSAETFFCIDFPSDTVGYFGGDHGTVLKFTGLPNGISENQTKNDLRIYPNPSNGSMTIQNIIPGSEITIRDLSGQIIKTIKAESEVMIMNLENVAVGIYFIEMKNEKINAVQKIVVN